MIASYAGTSDSGTSGAREIINGFGLSSATYIDASPPAGVSCAYEVIVFAVNDGGSGTVTSAPITVSNRSLQLLELKR